MKTKRIQCIQNVIINLFFLCIGILFFIDYTLVWVVIYILTILSLTLLGSSQLLSVFRNKKSKSWNDYLSITSSFSFALFILVFPINFFKFVHIIIGWWILIKALIGFINFLVYRKDCLKGASWIFTISIIDTFFALTLILAPRNKLWLLSFFAGLYFIFYGLISTSEAIKDILPDSTKNKVRRHCTVSAPVLLAALIPQRFFISIKGMVKQNKMLLTANPYMDDSTELEVFIYLKESGPESLGHVDISFENKIYSYGCHDPNERKLFGTLGDGVLIVANRNDFIQNAINNDEKTIIGYRIQLTPTQKSLLRNKLSELIDRCYPWSSQAETAKKDDQDHKVYTDYASRVYSTCHASMYKFTQGKFKTYFVFSTNCVLLADYLIRTDGLDLIKTSGIVTPGSYISFLNQELSRDKGIVISRTIYQKGFN